MNRRTCFSAVNAAGISFHGCLCRLGSENESSVLTPRGLALSGPAPIRSRLVCEVRGGDASKFP
ncbi:hypothetical protein RB1276 [Rhodopirellula baltica SH 1]|uniref:Uncharacterized protein n=1 Tax=Rhodopirellula baltica (strain DSM 10527 / NCIMB 13988 / SH1) TaxID=243090 RepID=Q7UXK1_RHOBA|nr:hypothetical protein RB1276 [Rhodopirellula baltica SH 1]